MREKNVNELDRERERQRYKGRDREGEREIVRERERGGGKDNEVWTRKLENYFIYISSHKIILSRLNHSTKMCTRVLRKTLLFLLFYVP